MSAHRRLALWTGYVNAIGWAPGELDSQEFSAFSKAAFYRIDQEVAFNLVLSKMQGSGAKKLRLSKVRHSLGRAYATGGDGIGQTAPPPLALPPIEPYNEARLKETVSDLAGQVDESFFIERSPVTTWNRTPAGFLHRIFEPGEYAWVTAEDRSANGCLWTHWGPEGCRARWITIKDDSPELRPETLGPNFTCLNWFERGCQNVWFLANPIDGKWHSSDRFSAGVSYRCLEAVTTWRHLVLETDCAPAALWLALLALLPLRIVAIYMSGGRGAHALVRIKAHSKLAADDIAELYKRDYVPLGACEGTLSAFRLTRLPNCLRGQTGRLQQLLYLDPQATGVPIKDLPILRKIPSE